MDRGSVMVRVILVESERLSWSYWWETKNQRIISTRYPSICCLLLTANTAQSFYFSRTPRPSIRLRCRRTSSLSKRECDGLGYNVQRGIPERKTVRFCISSNLGSHQSVEEHTARNIGDLYRLHAAPLHRSPQNAGKQDTLQV